LETIPLYLENGEYLIQALKKAGYTNIPSDVVLDKTIPGVGATYTEINAKRYSIIIEPNVPVIKGKIKKHHELGLFGIYKGVTVKQIEKYLLGSNTTHKKLLTTPEGFWKIKKAVTNIGMDLYTDFFCLFDECERITQDIGYRKNISNPVKDFFKFKSKAFVSATPLDIHHKEIDRQGFVRLKVEPRFDYKKEIQLILTNDVVNVLREKFYELSHSKCVCIFFNSTMGISSIIHSLGLHNYKIFCSEDSAKKLKDSGFKNVETEFSLPLGQFNFFTSRFFSAIDIELKVKPDILIYTDLKQAEHTIIDPYSEAIQIQGRFRTIFDDGKTYNSLTHITNYKGEMRVKTVDELNNEIEFYRTHYEFLSEQCREADSANLSNAIRSEITNSSYSRLLDGDGDIDEFAIHNLFNEERVRSYYTSIDALKDAYIYTRFFNVDFKLDLRFNLEDARLSIKRIESKKKKIIRMVSLLQNAPDTEELIKAIESDFTEAYLIGDAYKKLGVDFIQSVDYSLSKIRKSLIEFDSNKKRFCPEIILEISDSFELGVRQSKNFYKEKLREIYSKYGIVQKVTQTTIKDYFDITMNNEENTITLKRFASLSSQ